jgi:hypothetical protein
MEPGVPFRMMGGHSIHFEDYVNRIPGQEIPVRKKLKPKEPILRKMGGGMSKKWRRERDSNPRYTFKGRTIA